jgi:ketosteroid isomerase-like protein
MITSNKEETNEHDHRRVCGRRSHGRESVRPSYLSEDCVLRFANADEVVGRDAIEQAIAGFFSTIKGLSHHIVEQWDVDDTTIVQTEATYTRLDDRRVTVPAITVYRRGGDLINEYRIFVDLAPVYA